MENKYIKKELVIGIIIILIGVNIGTTIGVNLEVTTDFKYAKQSVDGKIAFASDRSGNWDIWSMNIDGTELTQLTFDEGPDIAPDISPDCEKIVFISGRTGYPQPWLKNLITDEEYQLFDVLELPIPYSYPKKIDYIKWHSSGDYIIVEITLMGIHSWPWSIMYRCDPDGSNVIEFLEFGPSIKGKWDISSDGNRLAYCREDSNYNAYSLKITIGDIVDGIIDPSSLYNLDFTIDNKRDKGVNWYMNDEKLLWRKGKDPSNLFTAYLDGSGYQQITFFNSGGGVVEPDVSPDDNYVIYNSLTTSVHLGGYDWWGIDIGNINMIGIDGSNDQLIIGNDGYYYQCPVWYKTIPIKDYYVAFKDNKDEANIKLAILGHPGNWSIPIYQSDLYDITPVNLEGKCGNLDVTADGKKIVFAYNDKDNWDIAMGDLNLNDYTIDNIKYILATEEHREEDPRFSWDGTKIVLKRDFDIYIYDIEEEILIPDEELPNLPRDGISNEDWGPCYNSDGTRIVFTRRLGNNDKKDEIFYYDLTSNSLVEITDNNRPDRYPIFLPDERIVFSRYTRLTDDDLYIYNLTNPPEIRLYSSWFRSDADPYPVRDNPKYMIFISEFWFFWWTWYDLYLLDLETNDNVRLSRYINIVGPTIFQK